MTSHAMHDAGLVEKWLAPRWKTVAAFVLTLIGALCQLIPASTALHAVNGFLVTVFASLGVHKVANAGVAPVQDVVDAVVDAVPPHVAPAVAQAVTDTTTGVLKDAVGATTAVAGDVVGGVGDVLAGATGTAVPNTSLPSSALPIVTNPPTDDDTPGA